MISRVALLLLLLTATPHRTWATTPGKTAGVVTPPAIEASALTSMPVKELTVFKDGHAFALHEDSLPTDGVGNIVIDTLPTPVLGTFWAYSADEHAQLASVVAGQRTVRSEQPVLSIREMIEANSGAAVTLIEHDNTQYHATLVGIPRRGEDWRGSGVPTTDAQSAAPGGPAGSADFVLLRGDDGTWALPLNRIRTVLFHDEPRTDRIVEDRRNLLTLQLDWGAKAPAAEARVGMVYLQRGVRWIPNYRIDIDGEGQAQIRLQATLVNELVDLAGVTTHLVIGVPSFRFRDVIDPIALQTAVARLAPEFQQRASQFQQAFDNSIMSQVSGPPGQTEAGAGQPGWGADANPEFMAGSRREDLYIFTIPNVTLRQGERMVVTVAEFTLPYEDVFALDVDFAPPPEIDHSRPAHLAASARDPVVLHRIRLRNSSRYPLTTAPAIVLRDGQLLAQSMVTYTAIGSAADVDVTTAVDLRASNSDLETGRTPEAMTWGSDRYGRIDLRGVISIANLGDRSATIEITRTVLGGVDTAEQDGEIRQTNAFEDVIRRQQAARWWGNYQWPHWWPRVNGVGRIAWEVTLDAGARTELAYTWHYFWR